MVIERADQLTLIRPARIDEAGLLSDLALRSKGLWGYTADFLAACRDELTLSAEYIETSLVYILQEDDRIVGFYGLMAKRSDAVELLYLFIEPEALKRGYGRRLWEHATMVAAGLGYRKIIIQSDPHAEPFYQLMGARRVGVIDSLVQANRSLPLMEFQIRK
jgi:N-acetylglutamate synthase-like GNAT family acetyltransferase